jgi:CubicO group peptidase (beta-lactamase class C family)
MSRWHVVEGRCDLIATDAAHGFDRVTARIDELVERRRVVGMAVGVVGDGGLDFFHGHGLADIGSATPITEDTVFRIASITKTFTAIAVMQLWERGLVDLDAPVNDYLQAYKVIPARTGFQEATVRHLLTHTAGIGEVAHPWGILRPDFGESFAVGRPLPSLSQFYGGGLRLRAEPGTRFVYNNHGPATLGQMIEDVTDTPLDRYFTAHIFEPLGMADSGLARSDRVKARLATGYAVRATGPHAVNERDMVTAGAASIYSTPRDMSRYLAALLSGGAGEYGSILQPATLTTMFEPNYRPDPRIPGMGLGFFLRDLAGHHVVGHQGSHPGFHSQISLAPHDGVGVMAFTNGAEQADFWLPGEVSDLLGEVLGCDSAASAGEIPHDPEIWDDIRGWYRLAAGLTDVRLRAMMGVGAEVFIRDGLPRVRFLSPIPAMLRGFPMLPVVDDDPYVFGIDVFGSGHDLMRIVFGQDRDGATTRLCMDLMPLVLDKRPEWTNLRRWTTAGMAAGAAAGGRRILRRCGRIRSGA